jgi:hypothetical protein
MIRRKRQSHDSCTTIGSHDWEHVIKLTLWNRVPEKLIVTRVVKKFPAFYGTQGFTGTYSSTLY